MRRAFQKEITTNIARHVISGRLDHIKDEFELSRKMFFDIKVDPDWLNQACHYGHSDILEYLLEQSDDASKIQDFTSIFRNNDAKTVEILIKHGAKFSAKDLASASYWGSFEIVSKIISNSQFDQKDYTIALFASLSFTPNKEVVKLLLKEGADKNSLNVDPIEEKDLNKSAIEMVQNRFQETNDKEWQEILAILNQGVHTPNKA